jgi:hypothetical protein
MRVAEMFPGKLGEKLWKSLLIVARGCLERRLLATRSLPETYVSFRVEIQFTLGGNRPQRRTMDAVILPVSCCDTNA